MLTEQELTNIGDRIYNLEKDTRELRKIITKLSNLEEITDKFSERLEILEKEMRHSSDTIRLIIRIKR